MADLFVEKLQGRSFAAVMARKGVGAAAIGSALGLEAPCRPAVVEGAGGISLIGTGAGTWLAMAQDANPLWADELARSLAGLASVSDQSGSYALVRLCGESTRTVLQRGTAIDFHPDAFPPGCAATTVIAHIGAILWRCEDNAARQPVFEIAVFRSYHDSFEHWLGQTIAAL